MKYLEYLTIAFAALSGATTLFDVDRAALRSVYKVCAIKASRQAVVERYAHYDSGSFAGLGS